MIPLPPCMWPAPRRKTKSELEFERKQEMGKTIMSALARYQPKKKRKRRPKEK